MLEQAIFCKSGISLPVSREGFRETHVVKWPWEGKQVNPILGAVSAACHEFVSSVAGFVRSAASMAEAHAQPGFEFQEGGRALGTDLFATRRQFCSLPMASVTAAIFGGDSAGHAGRGPRSRSGAGLAGPEDAVSEQEPARTALQFIRARPKEESSSLPKPEYWQVVKIRGDGRCMFRALVVGLAHNKGETMTSVREEEEADQLRMAVAQALCRNDVRRKEFEEALVAITLDESLSK
eukprot:jgi/Mesvir1/1585/Mv14554-RA.1